MWETWVRSLGWEDPLEKGKAIHSSILAWRIPWTVQSVGLQRVRHDWVTLTFTFHIHPKLSEGNFHMYQLQRLRTSKTEDLTCHSPVWWWYGIADLLLCIYTNQEQNLKHMADAKLKGSAFSPVVTSRIMHENHFWNNRVRTIKSPLLHKNNKNTSKKGQNHFFSTLENNQRVAGIQGGIYSRKVTESQ